MAAAVNDWLVAEWLEQEPRLRASMVVPTRVPEMGAEEIDRLGGHPGSSRSAAGALRGAVRHRRYWPIFEAAARHDLVVASSSAARRATRRPAAAGPRTTSRSTSAWPRSFRRRSSTWSSRASSTTSRTLRIALIEGGWTWLPSLMWRIDKDWKGLRREVPWNTRVPSEYIRERMRLSLQPHRRAARSQAHAGDRRQMGSDELLMFSTDYPHWQFDTPEEALPPRACLRTLRRKILYRQRPRLLPACNDPTGASPMRSMVSHDWTQTRLTRSQCQAGAVIDCDIHPT